MGVYETEADRWTSRWSTPSRPPRGTATRATCGPSRPTGTTGPAARIWQRFARRRARRRRAIACSTSAAAPGALTRDVAARSRPSGAVTGIDLSTRMLELARTRSADEGPRQRDLRPRRRPGLPVRAGGVRRRDEQLRRDVLQRPGRRVHQHRRRAATGRRGSRSLAWRTLPENEWLMSLRGALASGPGAAACRRPTRRRRSRSPTRSGSAASWSAAGFDGGRARRRSTSRSTSAPTPRTRSGSPRRWASSRG